MRGLAIKFVILALAVACVPTSAGANEPQQKPATIDSMTAAELEAAGEQARAQKNDEQAIKYFEAAIRKDRKNAVLYNKLGLAELKTNDLRSARIAFQNAVKRNSKYADALNNLGAVDYMQKRYGTAAKQFKKAVALDETRATFHVNLGATWFAQKNLEGAVTEYARALQLDPDALANSSRIGVAAQIASPEERAKYSYMLAKIYAKRGEAEKCLRCLKLAKEEGYRGLANVYRDEEFTNLRQDPRLGEIVPADHAK